MIARWTKPGDLVLDLFAGEGGVARACYDLGRRCVAAEIWPERHARAVGLLAHHVGGRR
jgi:DNA modification methylase